MQDIVALQRTESNRIGFLPKTAIVQHVERGWCITAIAAGHVIGYVLGWHRMRYNPEIRPVTQLIVLRRFRRLGLATALLTAWKEKALADGKTICQAWTRSDLHDAHAFWKNQRWTAICTRTPTTARGKSATLYRISLTAIPSHRLLEIPTRGGWNAAAITATPTTHHRAQRQPSPETS